jgi:predicted NAD/FAD-binding protein
MSKPTNKPKRKIAVVGSGIAGLSAAWALHNSKSYEVHIYEESSDHLGGHTNTVSLCNRAKKKTKVDTGFTVLNAEAYRDSHHPQGSQPLANSSRSEFPRPPRSPSRQN